MSRNSVYCGPAEIDKPIYQEKLASEAMKPGHMVVVNGDDFDLNALNGADGDFLILKERGLGEGEKYGINPSVDFADGDALSAYKGRKGHIFQARFATGVTLVKDETKLAFGTAGRLRVALTDGSQTYVATALESVTTSADDELVLVEVFK